MFRMVARNALSSRLQYRRSPIWVVFLVLLACSLLTSIIGPTTASAEPFSNASFQQYWQSADYPVAIGAVTRGYTWGPSPFFNTSESYTEGPGGMRQVEYFDKTRMEITRPADISKSNPYYVTNGLLVKEMVTGLRQDGDYAFKQRFPAYDVPVAGDPVEVNGAAPTYASFYALNSFYHTILPTTTITGTNGITNSIGTVPFNLPQTAQTGRNTLADVGVPTDTGSGLLQRQPDRTNEPADDTLNRDGTHNKNSVLGAIDGANYVFWERTLGHNIPQVFYDYLNQNGPVFNGKGLVDGKIFDWVQTMGYPISDAYWVRTNVGGISRDVMVQLYERRILTFTPSNPVQFRVEMGNVGQHYYKWRYNPKYNLTLPLQSNAEVKPEAGFPGSTFSIKVYGMLGTPNNGSGVSGNGEDIQTTVYTPDGLPLIGQIVPASNPGTGFTFFPLYVITDGATPPGQYEIKFKGTVSGNEAKAYFFVLGIPGYNLPAS